MGGEFIRTELLLGKKGVLQLQSAHVAVFGVGGVGSYAVEALARGGVGKLHLIDNDEVSISNINRQLVALHSTIGRKKTLVAKERVLDINPQAEVFTSECFFSAENAADFNFTQYDYIVDAIDTVSSKLELITRAYNADIPIISCMGAGNKLDPKRFEVTDIYKTEMCPLARTMRRELRKRGVGKLKVVYSREPAIKPIAPERCCEEIHESRRQTPGSISFVPSVAGLILAGEVIRDIVF